jgi:hypothetical protein
LDKEAIVRQGAVDGFGYSPALEAVPKRWSGAGRSADVPAPPASEIHSSLVRVGQNVGMFPFGARKRCVRCGSRQDVQTVKYKRGDEKRTEPWCRPCRRRKLSSSRPHPSNTEITPARSWDRLGAMDRPGV